MFCLEPLQGSFCMFRILDLLQNPWPLMNTESDIVLQNSLLFALFHDAMHTHSRGRGSKTTQNISDPPLCVTVWRCSCLWRLPLFSVIRDGVVYQNALIWSHLSSGHSPRRVLACSGVFLMSVGSSYRTCLESVWRLTEEVRFLPLNYSSLWSSISFSLAATSTFSYST